ncbi:hypothetical protein HID58_042867 [Brassica napus]|uniref:Uncharacterized protein n=1 Tax=Brassica napus TaxID=3708 RepID=A0ABQ8BEV6_BRANA|nr:hypothetical protein HID58_042867 [Brassica napus]
MDEHQKAKTRKRRPFHTPPPRLERAASLVNGLSFTSSTDAEAVSNDDLLVDAHRRLIGESGAEHYCSPGSVDSAGEGVGQMGAHEGIAGDPVWGGIDQQSGSFSWVATPRSITFQSRETRNELILTPELDPRYTAAWTDKQYKEWQLLRQKTN